MALLRLSGVDNKPDKTSTTYGQSGINEILILIYHREG